ncbi:MAG: hypothetical protein ABJA67_12105 [Chthonomonadales bacterium]
MKSNSHMSRNLILFSGLAMVTFGCGNPRTSTMGSPPAESASITTVSHLTKTDAGTVVKGKMIEKCPVAGCWFMLKDSTGVIKVDTKNAGFVVTEIPVNTEITVIGKPDLGDEKKIVASGIRF